MEEYILIELANCPRCRDRGYEQLPSHSYCAACNFSPTLDYDGSETVVPQWAIDALKASTSRVQQQSKASIPLMATATARVA